MSDLMHIEDWAGIRGGQLQALAERGHCRITVEKLGPIYRVLAVEPLSKPGYIQVRDGDTVTIPVPRG
jgi:hypothetical protein